MRWRRCEWRITIGLDPRPCGKVAYWQEAGVWFCRTHWQMVQKRLEQEVKMAIDMGRGKDKSFVLFRCDGCGRDVAVEIAPGWKLVCPRCGRSVPAADHVPDNELRALAGDR